MINVLDFLQIFGFFKNKELWSVALAPIITFIIGVSTVANNIRSNNKNNQLLKNLKAKELSANVFSKARIDWLETVRLHTAELVKNYIAVISNENLTNKGCRQTNYEDFIKYYYLLKLYYTRTNDEGDDNEDHKKLVEQLDYIYDLFISEFNYVTQENGEFDKEKFKSEMDKFIEDSSRYFKDVWEQAKSIE